MANEGPGGALASLDLEDATGSWMVYFTQVPLAIYFLVSLQDIPLAMAMAGGYGKDIADTVQVQINTFALAYASWQHWQNR